MGTSVESSRRCRIFVIVNGCRIQVGDLLIKLSFAGTDFTDVLQLLIEILLCQIRSSFQSFIIHHPAFDGVVLGIACNLTRTFGLNYSEIPDCYFTLVSIRWFSLTSFTALSTWLVWICRMSLPFSCLRKQIHSHFLV